ncbi:kinase-like domain-containing protein, partial [Baffinella frigidus]
MSSDWDLDIVLGSGANGTAYLAFRRDYITGQADKEHKYVIKKVFIGSETVLAKSAKLRETQLLAMIRHPYIVTYEDCFIEDGHLFVAMEFAGGGTMEKFTDPGAALADLATVRELFAMCLQGIDYLHRKNIVHRDMKPANVFIREDGCVKLGDLGEGWLRDTAKIDPNARWEDDPSQKGQLIGTPYYLAPECWMGKSTNPDKADTWALGVMLYELLSRARPFMAKSIHQLASRICMSPWTPLPPGCDAPLQEVITLLLDKDQDARLTAAQVLEHPALKATSDAVRQPEAELNAGADARESLPPCSFLFQWGLRSAQPACVESLLHKNIRQVSVGRYHVAAVSLDGELFTWSLMGSESGGADRNAGLGHGSATRSIRHPYMLRALAISRDEVVTLDPLEHHFRAVACGDRFTAAVTEEGRLFAWGVNDRGQLGIGEASETPWLYPTEVLVSFDRDQSGGAGDTSAGREGGGRIGDAGDTSEGG